VVLFTGAVGVGRTAVHVAKQHGAFVIACVRSSERIEAESLSSDRVIALDDEKEIAALPQLDAIADMVGHETIDRLLPHIRKNGVLATVVGAPNSAKRRALRVVSVFAQPDATRLEEIGAQVAGGTFSIPIDKRLRLAQLREA